MTASLLFAFPRDDVQWAEEAASPGGGEESRQAHQASLVLTIVCKYGIEPDSKID